MDGVERILRAHARPNDEVVVEDPCYSGVLDLVRGVGLRPVPVRLDEQGPIRRSLAAALSGGAQLMIITPRAQNPTGAAITPARGRRLRSVLRKRPDLHIVENDYLALTSGHAVRRADGRPGVLDGGPILQQGTGPGPATGGAGR